MCPQAIVRKMNIEQYLANFKNSRQINVVGPLYEPDDMREPMRAIAEPIIFVDGGACWRQRGEGITVGDGDSFVGTMDVLLKSDKCFSDLAFALEHIPATFREVKLHGFLGGRRDHELFNIGEVHHFLRNRKSPTTIQFEHDIVGYSGGQWQFERVGGFSIAVIEETQISISGDCRYTCQARRFMPLCSLGLSNVGAGLIYIDCAAPIFILFNDSVDGGLVSNDYHD